MSTEQLPPLPPADHSYNSGSFAPLWNEKSVREAQRAAIAADRARREGEAVVYAWRYSRNDGKTWHVTDAGDPTDLMPDTGGIVIPLVAATHPATDASQAEQAAMYRWLRENHAWWMLNRFPAQEEYTDPRVVFDDAIRTAMKGDAS